ncbi:MAG: hypothetical protein LBH32_03475 [Dysgonamonadaceae bacterium]|jgi:hypothetical protein|nr:hypothetical protein [Dysgonamonadaceae bacterium]
MNKQIIHSVILLICIALPFSAYSQKFVFGYSLGKAGYQMGDMKSILENDVKNEVKAVNDSYELDFKYKNTENFPDGLFHDAYLGLQFSFHEIGLQYNYLTTGGRNHLSDYSGELRKDIVFSGDALGLYYKCHFLSVPLTKDFSFSASAGVATGAIFNYGHLDYFLDLYNPQIFQSDYYVIGSSSRKFEKKDESYDWNSTNWYVQPTVGLQLWWKKTVSLNINAGYLFDNPGKIRTADENTTDVIGVYDTYYGNRIAVISEIPGREYNFGANWSGIRLSVGIGFAFSVTK